MSPKPQPNPDRLETFKQATLATARAIAGDHEIAIDFGSDTRGHAHLPPPPPHCTEADITKVRAAADEFSLRHRYHKQEIHRRRAPRSLDAMEIFNQAETARVNSIGCNRMAGLAANLEAKLEAHCEQLGFYQQSEPNPIALPLALALIIKERLTGRPLPPIAAGTANLWRTFIETSAKPLLDALPEVISDQGTFAERLMPLIQALGYEIEQDLPSDQSVSNDDDANTEEETSLGDEAQSDDFDASLEDAAADESSQGLAEAMADAELLEDQGTQETEMPAGGMDEAGRILPDPDYKIFTTEYDEVVMASDLCSPEELRALYEILKEKLKGLEQGTSQLANRLQRQLMAKQLRSWHFDQESGLLDTSRLAGIIANPSNQLVFKEERETDFRHTTVMLLIDSSGSMRGRAISIAAMCTSILGRVLERCSVKVEILGFTTTAWRGGKSREKWLAAGKPPRPGRLCDLRHVIYKSADDSWRRAAPNLGLMMREELLKENIDGEALIWAHNRLISREESRKILMVISDGLPVDNATLLVNPSNCLEDHLKYAIDLIEKQSPVELIAIGIGHDVTHHYQRAVTITEPEQLGGAMVNQLAALFAKEDAPRP